MAFSAGNLIATTRKSLSWIGVNENVCSDKVLKVDLHKSKDTASIRTKNLRFPFVVFTKFLCTRLSEDRVEFLPINH